MPSPRESIQYVIPKDARAVLCRGASCHKRIFYVVTPAGKLMPVNPDGTPHWGTCPDAKRFKRSVVEKDGRSREAKTR